MSESRLVTDLRMIVFWAEFLSWIGKYDKVEEYYKRAIDIYAKHYGPHDSNVIKTRNNLASAYLREGKYKLASQLYQQVLAESQMIVNEQCSSSSQSAFVVPALKNLSMDWFASRFSKRERDAWIASCS